VSVMSAVAELEECSTR